MRHCWTFIFLITFARLFMCARTLADFVLCLLEATWCTNTQHTKHSVRNIYDSCSATFRPLACSQANIVCASQKRPHPQTANDDSRRHFVVFLSIYSYFYTIIRCHLFAFSFADFSLFASVSCGRCECFLLHRQQIKLLSSLFVWGMQILSSPKLCRKEHRNCMQIKPHLLCDVPPLIQPEKKIMPTFWLLPIIITNEARERHCTIWWKIHAQQPSDTLDGPPIRWEFG